MNRLFFLLFLLGFLPCSPLGAQQIDYSDAISRMENLHGNAFRLAVDSILLSLDTQTDYQLKTTITRKVFDITAEKDEIAHVRSLTYLVIYADTARPELFYQARRLALKNNLPKLAEYVEDRQSRYFIARQQYDSAMVHLLRIKDATRTDLRNDDSRNNLDLLGDLYFKTSLYDAAKAIYFDIYQQYQQAAIWDLWRPYVMMNNLGQIAVKQKDYGDAIRWFTHSLSQADQNLFTFDRNNIMAYINLKLAETYLLMGNQDSAAYYVRQAEQFPSSTIFEDVQQEFLFIKSKIALNEGNYPLALQLSNQLKPGDSILFNYYRFIPEAYLLLSEIYGKSSEPDSSLKYLRLYTNLTDSLAQEGSQARSMIILAQQEHESIKNKLQTYQQRYYLVSIGIVTLLAVIMLILWLYRKLYRTQMALVERLVEKNQGLTIQTKEYVQKAEWDQKWDKQYQLIVRLQQLMITHKPHLNPNINIQLMAELMDTNRTYLSKAINTVLETNFSKFINEYRISEAIKLISEGFASNHTVEALAQHAGFANRAVFNSVFKKQTGVTPSFFIGNYKRKLVDLSRL